MRPEAWLDCWLRRHQRGWQKFYVIQIVMVRRCFFKRLSPAQLFRLLCIWYYGYC